MSGECEWRDVEAGYRCERPALLARIAAVEAWAADLAQKSRADGPSPDAVGRAIAREVAALTTVDASPDAPDRCEHCTSFTEVEASILMCRRLVAGMCPAALAASPTPTGPERCKHGSTGPHNFGDADYEPISPANLGRVCHGPAAPEPTEETPKHADPNLHIAERRRRMLAEYEALAGPGGADPKETRE